jgi:hypothetical protein
MLRARRKLIVTARPATHMNTPTHVFTVRSDLTYRTATLQRRVVPVGLLSRHESTIPEGSWPSRRSS